MNHIESSVKIYFSSDYAQFRMIEGNRQLDEAKIKRIIKDIADGIDVLRYYPICVHEKDGLLEIIDGQHRFYVARRLKKPVHYIIQSEYRDMTDIAKINSNTSKWTNKDYLNCYLAKGIKDYKTLQNFCDTYHISITVSAKMLMEGTPGTENGSMNMATIFKKGMFRVKQYEEAKSIAETCKLFHNFDYWNERAFIIAIYKIMTAQKVEINDVVAEFKKDTTALRHCATYKEYLFNLEQIMNKSQKKYRITIY